MRKPLRHLAIIGTISLGFISCSKDGPTEEIIPVNDGKAVITNVTPSSGSSGDIVTINGANFPGKAIALYFNRKISTVISATSTQIVAVVPSGVVSDKVSLESTNGAAVSKDNFTIDHTNRFLLPDGPRLAAVSFVIGSKAYLSTGRESNIELHKDLWEYNPNTKTWAQKMNYPGDFREGAMGFAIGNKGYVGGGIGWGMHTDFWEYDPSVNNWIRKADIPIEMKAGVSFVINNKGYVSTGEGKELFEYDPNVNKWTEKAPFGGMSRQMAAGFTIGNKGYIGTGLGDNNVQYKDFWEYDPITNIWTQKADFGGIARSGAVGFTIGDKGYIGTGFEKTGLRDVWEYNPGTNTWIRKTDFEACPRGFSSAFVLDNTAYISGGKDELNNYEDIRIYKP